MYRKLEVTRRVDRIRAGQRHARTKKNRRGHRLGCTKQDTTDETRSDQEAQTVNGSTIRETKSEKNKSDKERQCMSSPIINHPSVESPSDSSCPRPRRRLFGPWRFLWIRADTMMDGNQIITKTMRTAKGNRKTVRTANG